MPITRLADSGTQAGAISAFDITTVPSTDRIVTAVRQPNNILKLISWEYDNDGTITRLGDSGDRGSVTNVSMPRATALDEIYTACRQPDGSRNFARWKLLSSGDFSAEISGHIGDKMTDVASTTVGQKIITVQRDMLGDFHLKSWNKSLAPLGSANAKGVTTLGRPVQGDVIVTPVTTACSELQKLIAWQLDQTGHISRLGDSGQSGGVATRIACAHIGGKWATAIRSGSDSLHEVVLPLGGGTNGELRVMFWTWQDGAMKLLAEAADSGSNIADVDIAALDFNDISFGSAKEQYRVIVAVRTRTNSLRMTIWSYDPVTNKVTRVGNPVDGMESISRLRLLGVANDLFITAVRDDSTQKGGNLIACKTFENDLSDLEKGMQGLQQELQEARPGERPAIRAQIEKLNARIAEAKQKLAECINANEARTGHLKLITWRIS
jgi:hypothetical protein